MQGSRRQVGPQAQRELGGLPQAEEAIAAGLLVKGKGKGGAAGKGDGGKGAGGAKISSDGISFIKAFRNIEKKVFKEAINQQKYIKSSVSRLCWIFCCFFIGFPEFFMARARARSRFVVYHDPPPDVPARG